MNLPLGAVIEDKEGAHYTKIDTNVFENNATGKRVRVTFNNNNNTKEKSAPGKKDRGEVYGEFVSLLYIGVLLTTGALTTIYLASLLLNTFTANTPSLYSQRKADHGRGRSPHQPSPYA